MKTLLALLALLFAGKLGKVLLTAGTMFLSMFVYAISFGWAYAAGVVAMLFLHEMGHFIAARKRGLEVGAPVFIPFVGAWVALKATDLDPETEAYVGLGGPLLGTAAAFLCYLYGLDTGERLWLAVAYTGFMLNAFNLIPLSPLDGGRIVRVISPRIWFLGVPLLIGAFLWKPSPLLLIIAILAAPQLWAAWRGEDAAVRHITATRVKWVYGAQYLALVAALALLAFEVHERLGA